MGAGRGRRTGLILIVVIILLLVGGVGILLVSAVLTPPVSATPAGGEVQPTPVSTVKILVAAHDIRRGSRLTAQDVTTADWPLNLALPANAMTAGDTPDQPGPEQVEDTVARVDILQGQPVLSHMITPPGQADLQSTGSDAALLIPTGQVAVAFPLNRLSGVAYALRTGDHVDILMSFRFVSVDNDFQTILPNNIGIINATLTPLGGGEGGGVQVGREESGPFGSRIWVVPSENNQRVRQVTQLVIKNAIVLRVGDWPLGDVNASIVVTQPPPPPEGATPTPEGAGPTPIPEIVPDVITVVMSRQDALVLKYSLETGADIDFALRSALDNDLTDVSTDSVTLQYLMDFYDIVEPPLLPISQQPRIEEITNPTGEFQAGGGAEGAVTPPPE